MLDTHTAFLFSFMPICICATFENLDQLAFKQFKIDVMKTVSSDWYFIIIPKKWVYFPWQRIRPPVLSKMWHLLSGMSVSVTGADDMVNSALPAMCVQPLWSNDMPIWITLQPGRWVVFLTLHCIWAADLSTPEINRNAYHRWPCMYTIIRRWTII